MEESTFKKLELSDEVLDGMENLLHVASDFTRLKIMYSIMNGEKCVSDIVRVVGAEQSLVSHQLKVLKNANLAEFHALASPLNRDLTKESSSLSWFCLT